ncbi:MAG: hypothetical protein QM734_17640 [Cyclobacteriaceae bacterium]
MKIINGIISEPINNDMKTNDLRMPKCRLKILKCHQSSEGNGDEIFMMFGGQKFWPQKKYEKIKGSGEAAINQVLYMSDPNEMIFYRAVGKRLAL